MPLCGTGEYDRVKFPVLFADAQMPLYACGLDIDKDKQPDVVLIYAGEPKHRKGIMQLESLVKAMMPHEFIETLYPEHKIK